MPTTRTSRPIWRFGYWALAAIPSIAVAMTLADPPLWLLLVAIVVSGGLLGVGTTLLRRPKDAWLPSRTLPDTAPPRPDER